MNVGLVVGLSVGGGFLLVVTGVSIFTTVLIHRALGKKQSSAIQARVSTTVSGEASGTAPTVETSFTSTTNEIYCTIPPKDYEEVLPSK